MPILSCASSHVHGMCTAFIVMPLEEVMHAPMCILSRAWRVHDDADRSTTRRASKRCRGRCSISCTTASRRGWKRRAPPAAPPPPPPPPWAASLSEATTGAPTDPIEPRSASVSLPRAGSRAPSGYG